MTSVPIRELRNHTAEVLRRVQAGEDITVTQNGVPVAALVSVQRPGPRVPINRADLLALLDRHPSDPAFAADIAALTSDPTDDLGSM